LTDVWGEVPKKEITAIMGPSGAGKTSLLNILAGRTRTAGKIKVSADVRLNNYAVDPTSLEIRKQIAFVAQDDSLQATATPREAIRFSAKLRLPRGTTEQELDTLTNRMLDALGLTHCADTFIGGDLLKGISGGERKRTSVGVELVTKPALVFLDGEFHEMMTVVSFIVSVSISISISGNIFANDTCPFLENDISHLFSSHAHVQSLLLDLIVSQQVR